MCVLKCVTSLQRQPVYRRLSLPTAMNRLITAMPKMGTCHQPRYCNSLVRYLGLGREENALKINLAHASCLIFALIKS